MKNADFLKKTLQEQDRAAAFKNLQARSNENWKWLGMC